MGTMPAATAAAEPPDDPPGTRSGASGLRVGPNALCSVDEPIPNSSMFVFPNGTAPAARSFVTAVASNGVTYPSRMRDPQLVVSVVVAMLSLIATGTPRRSPGDVSLFICSAVNACARASLASNETKMLSASPCGTRAMASSMSVTPSPGSRGWPGAARERIRRASAARWYLRSGQVASVARCPYAGAVRAHEHQWIPAHRPYRRAPVRPRAPEWCSAPRRAPRRARHRGRAAPARRCDVRPPARPALLDVPLQVCLRNHQCLPPDGVVVEVDLGLQVAPRAGELRDDPAAEFAMAYARTDDDDRRVLGDVRILECRDGHSRPAHRGAALSECVVIVEDGRAQDVIHGGARLRAPPLAAAHGVHERAAGAAHLDRLAQLQQSLGDASEKARRLGRKELPVPAALLGVRKKELSFRARDADVEQPPLLLEQRRLAVCPCEWKEPVLEARDEYHRKFEPFCIVQRHQRHGVSIGTELVELRHQHGLLEKVIEWPQTDFPLLVGDELRCARDQLAHVLDALLALGPFCAKILVVLDPLDDVPQQLVHTGFLRRIAKPLDERRELRERPTCSRTNGAKQIAALRRGKHGNSRLAGRESQLLDRRFAKSTPRHDDGPTERLVVRGIGNELEGAHQVADFAAIVEPYRTDQPVRHGALSQCLLHRAAL